MHTPTCPKCQKAIPSDDVNVGRDVAYCRRCNLSHALSDLAHSADLIEGVDFSRPPAGVAYRHDGLGLVLSASHRSVGGALGLLAVALFWNGIVSVFVAIAISGTLRNLDIAAPAWFPAPDMNGNPMSWGMVLFLWLFLTPFIAIGLGMLAGFASCLAGRTEIRLSQSEGTVFTGVGPFGWRRRFNMATVKDVRIADQEWSDRRGRRQNKSVIIVETAEGKLLELGSMLTDERRKFVAAALRKALVR